MGTRLASTPDIPLLDVPASRVTAKGSRRNSFSAQDYAGVVKQHAKRPLHRTLYPGQIYEDLSGFLNGAPLSRRLIHDGGGAAGRTRSHASLYTLDGENAGRATNFSRPSACIRKLNANIDMSRAQILFLRGYSCPQWLIGVATALHTDPEFFNSNMLFRCRRDYFAYPSLPSAYQDIIRLRFISIGSRRTGEDYSNPDVVERLRTEADKQMEEYRQKLVNINVYCGDSIVREYHVLSERKFFLEQEVAICMHFSKGSWTALICSDVGHSLTEGPRGPWQSKPDSVIPTEFYPTIQHEDNIALKSRPVECDWPVDKDRSLPQTASLLALDYGRLLDGPAMAADPFYALNHLFRFAAASENQLLTSLEYYVSRDTDHRSLSNQKLTLSNLVYYREEILETHLSRLRENIETLRRRGGQKWPRISPDERVSYDKAEAAAEALLRDFEHLQHRALAICQRCDRGIQVIMSNRTLAESRIAISQARRVERLTFIAFVYIPLSFTTSFFGMNIAQLGTGPIPVWVWVATSIPVLLLTVVVFFFDAKRVKRAGQEWVSWVTGSHAANPSQSPKV